MGVKQAVMAKVGGGSLLPSPPNYSDLNYSIKSPVEWGRHYYGINVQLDADTVGRKGCIASFADISLDDEYIDTEEDGSRVVKRGEVIRSIRKIHIEDIDALDKFGKVCQNIAKEMREASALIIEESDFQVSRKVN